MAYGWNKLSAIQLSKNYKYKKEGTFAVFLYGKPLASICKYTRKLIFATAVLAMVKSSSFVGIPVYEIIQTLTSGFQAIQNQN